MSLYLGNTVISGVATPIDGSIAIGQIISSIIPLTDAGLHLLDGALIQGGGIYDDFVQYIAGLSSSYPSCFTDETTWQNTVSSKGACGKFVYDSTNNTVRLPKIIGFIEGTIDSNALGDLVEAGLPNISGSVVLHHANTYGTIAGAYGAFTPDTQVPNYGLGTGQPSTAYGSFNFSASDSNSIYGNSNTVQPQSIKVFYYIVIATTTKTDIEVDIDEVSSDLNTLTSQITNISSTLSTKANDNSVVHLTGDETITGAKHFYNNITYLSQTNDNTGLELQSNSMSYIRLHIPNSTFVSIGCRVNQEVLYVTSGDFARFAPIYAGYNIHNNCCMLNYNFQVVSTLPANPDGNVYYFIPE